MTDLDRSLLDVCFSPTGDVETAKTLLNRGADPNATQIDPQWPDWPLSCLYGATGRNNNPALALVLLRAGANPNDNESLYHSTEHVDLECMKLLLANGAKPQGTNALKHILDRDDPEGLALLLAAGADPNERNAQAQTSLHWAVRRGRSIVAIKQLLDAGAEIDAPGTDGRTAYALAVFSHQSEVAQLLRERGANIDVPPITPRDQHFLPDLAGNHHTAAIRVLLASGMPVNACNGSNETALHWACWKGYPDLVALLLEHGASLTLRDKTYQATPPEWYIHGSQNCHEPGSDYPEVKRLLLAAGAGISQQ